MLPRCFYDINAPVTCAGYNGEIRWWDKFSHPDGEERLVLTEQEWEERATRDAHYRAWLSKFPVKPKNPKWQVIQILTSDHSERQSRQWWDRYRDCVFRAYVNPEVKYCTIRKDHKSWYVISPEDCYLMQAYEAEQRGFTVPNRRTFQFISPMKALRAARLVPVECCRHFRHETTAGQLPGGL
jgi:hypothetical protein